MSLPMVLLPLVTLALCTTLAQADNTSSADMDKAGQQFRQYYLDASPAEAAEAAGFAASLQADGSWADVDYVSKDRAAWPAAEHVRRIDEMAVVMRRPGVSDVQREALEKAVHSALAYWREHDFHCPNWWWNRIGVPMRMGAIAILLNDRLLPSEFDYVTKTSMTRCGIGDSTGQNRVWLAGCTLMDGLIQRDAAKVAKSASTIFDEAVVTSKEGVQPDFSFHQHGPQLQFGNYGLSFAADQIKWLAILRGTPWAAPAAQVEVIRRYLLEGQNWVVWRGGMDISCCGRAFAPDAQTSRGDKLAELMNRMSTLDKGHSADYAAFVRRNEPGGVNDLVGCKHFWRSDYFVDRRKDFCVSVKMCSTRVTGTESLNGQNLSGYHLADGATYVYRQGDEYKDIFPVWNWRMLPGVTCAQGDGPLPSFGSYRLQTDFAGGVTDGVNGCAALDYSRDGVSAKKSWFFGGDEVVCLGSGVKAGPEIKAPVATTINQCLLRGKVRVCHGKSEGDLASGTHEFDDVQWVEHDGMRYSLAKGQKARITSGSVTGNWSRVAQIPSMPKGDVSANLFTLSIDHGSQPTDGSYAYGISLASDPAKGRFEILSNTRDLQAVGFGDKLVEAVFHAPGRLEFASGRFVEADSPCLVLLDVSKSTIRATVADPTQKLQSLSLIIDGNKHEVKLPAGDEAGKSVAVH